MDAFLPMLHLYIIIIWVDYRNAHGLYFNVMGGFWLLNRPTNGRFLTNVAFKFAVELNIAYFI